MDEPFCFTSQSAGKFHQTEMQKKRVDGWMDDQKKIGAKRKKNN
jgi:hypothetical protein